MEMRLPHSHSLRVQFDCRQAFEVAGVQGRVDETMKHGIVGKLNACDGLRQ